MDGLKEYEKGTVHRTDYLSDITSDTQKFL